MRASVQVQGSYRKMRKVLSCSPEYVAHEKHSLPGKWLRSESLPVGHRLLLWLDHVQRAEKALLKDTGYKV